MPYPTLRRAKVTYDVASYAIAVYADADEAIQIELTGGFLGTEVRSFTTFPFDPGDNFTKQYNATPNVGPGNGFVLRMRPVSSFGNWESVSFDIASGGPNRQVAFYDSTATAPSPSPGGGSFAVYVDSYNCATGVLTLGATGTVSNEVYYKIVGINEFSTQNQYTLPVAQYNGSTLSIEALNNDKVTTLSYKINCSNSVCDLTLGAVSQVPNTTDYEIAFTYTGGQRLFYVLYKDPYALTSGDNPTIANGKLRFPMQGYGVGTYRIRLHTPDESCTAQREFTIASPTTAAPTTPKPTTTVAPTTQPGQTPSPIPTIVGSGLKTPQTATVGVELRIETAYAFSDKAYGPLEFFAVGEGLPPGLTLDSITGLISGTPTTAGTVGMPIGVKNKIGGLNSSGILLTINPAPTTVPPTTIPPLPDSSYIYIRPRTSAGGFDVNKIYYYKCSSPDISEAECANELSSSLWDVLDELPDGLEPIPCPVDPIVLIARLCVANITPYYSQNTVAPIVNPTNPTTSTPNTTSNGSTTTQKPISGGGWQLNGTAILVNN